MVVLVAITLLVAVWWSPNVLRPSLGPAGVSGWFGSSVASAGTPLPAVLAESPMVADGWGSVELLEVEIDAVSGTRVAGAWVAPHAEDADTNMLAIQPEQFTSSLDFARRASGAAVLDETTALPHRVDVGESFRLVVLWEVTDCAALDRAFVNQVFVRLETIPGLERSVPIGILTPDHDTLVGLGGC